MLLASEFTLRRTAQVAALCCLLFCGTATAQTPAFRGRITTQVTTTDASTVGVWRYQSSATAGNQITATTTGSSFHSLSVRRCYPADLSDYNNLPFTGGAVATAQSSNGQQVTVGSCQDFSTNTPFFVNMNPQIAGTIAVSESAAPTRTVTVLPPGTTDVASHSAERVFSIAVPTGTELLSIVFAVSGGTGFLGTNRLTDSCGRDLRTGCAVATTCVFEVTTACGGLVGGSTLFLVLAAPSSQTPTLKINLQTFTAANLATTALTRGTATTLPTGPFSTAFYTLAQGTNVNEIVRLTPAVSSGGSIFITVGKNGKPGVNIECEANNVCNGPTLQRGPTTTTAVLVDGNTIANLGNNIITVRVIAQDGVASNIVATLTPAVTTVTPTTITPGTPATPMTPIARSSVAKDVYVIPAAALADPKSYLFVSLTGVSGTIFTTLGRGGYSDNSFFGCISGDETGCESGSCSRMFSSCSVPGTATGDFYLSITASSTASYSISVNVITPIAIDAVGTPSTGTIRTGWPQIFLFPTEVTSIPFTVAVTSGSVPISVRELASGCGAFTGAARTGTSVSFSSMCPTLGASRTGILLTGGSADTSYSVTVTAVSTTTMTAGTTTTWAGSLWPSADTTAWFKYTSSKSQGISLTHGPTNPTGIVTVEVWAPSCKPILRAGSFRTGNWWNLDASVNAAGDYFIAATRSGPETPSDRSVTIKAGRAACVDNNPNNDAVADFCKPIVNYQMAFPFSGAPSATKTTNDFTVMSTWFFDSEVTACSNAVRDFVCKYNYPSCDTDGLVRSVACRAECSAALAACASEPVCLPAMCSAVPQCTPFSPPTFVAPTSGGSAPTSSGSAPSSSGTSAPTSSGSAPTSSGSAPTSSGSAPTSSGSAPSSSGSAPSSSGSAPSSSGSAPSSSGSAPSGVNAPSRAPVVSSATCSAVSVALGVVAALLALIL